MTKEKLLDSITTLVSAGYSKDEINTLLGIGGTPEEKTPEEKTPEEKTPEEKTPEEKTPEEKTPEDKTSLFENMAVMSEGISKAIIEELQKSNILGSRMPEHESVTGEDILATVLDLIDK